MSAKAANRLISPITQNRAAKVHKKARFQNNFNEIHIVCFILLFL